MFERLEHFLGFPPRPLLAIARTLPGDVISAEADPRYLPLPPRYGYIDFGPAGTRGAI